MGNGCDTKVGMRVCDWCERIVRGIGVCCDGYGRVYPLVGGVPYDVKPRKLDQVVGTSQLDSPARKAECIIGS